MKTKNKAKINLFAMLGWLLWKLLALFGSRYAKNKLEQRQRDTRRAQGNPVIRGLDTLTDHTSRD